MSIPNILPLFQFSAQNGGGLPQGEGGLQGLFASLFQNVLGQKGISGEEITPEIEGGPSEDALIYGVEITQIVTVIYEEVTILSSNGFDLSTLEDIDSLADAYEQLGLSPEDAKTRATQLALFSFAVENYIQGSASAGTDELATQLFGQDTQYARGEAVLYHEERLTIQLQESIKVFAAVGAASGLALRDALQLSGGGAASSVGGEALASEQQTLDVVQTPPAIAIEEEAARVEETRNFNVVRPAQEGGFEKNRGDLTKLLHRVAQHLPGELQGTSATKLVSDVLQFIDQLAEDVTSRSVAGLFAALPEASSQQGVLASLPQVAKQSAVNSPNGFVVEETQTAEALLTNAQENTAGEQESREHEGSRGNDALVRNDRGGRASALSGTLSGHPQNADLGLSRSENFASELPSKAPILTEPPQAQYVVRPAAGGGVEVINPSTGEVVQTNYAPAAQSVQNPQTPQALQNAVTEGGVFQQRVNKQVQVHVRTLAGHGGGQIVVGLNPPELGRIQVRLEIVEGHVKGAITVQRADVAEALAKDLRSLTDAFSSLGLDLGQEGIAIQLENNPSHQGGENLADKKNSGTNFANSHTNGDVLQTQEAETTVWYDPDRLLDIHA